MVSYQTCLKKVIGLSTAGCDCPELAAASETYKESLSGLYIDDMQYGLRLKDIAIKNDCSINNVWNLMDEARSQALREFQTSFLGEVQNEYKERLSRYNGNIGDYSQASQFLIHNNTYVGQKFVTKPYRGATWTIKKMGLWTNAPNDTEFTVNIISSDPTQTIDPVTVTVKNNILNMAALTTPVELPMTDAMGNSITYWFIWDRQTYSMKDVKYHCGCGGSRPLWMTYMDAAGYETDSLVNYDVTSAGIYTNGLVMDSSLSCYGTDFVCRIDDTDWVNDPYAAVIAKTIQLIAIVKLISYILNSGTVNRYVLIESEELNGRVANLNKEITWRMKWLTQKMPKGASDCFECIDMSRITKHELIV